MTPSAVQPRPRFTVGHKRPPIGLSVPGLIFCSLMSFMGVAAVNSGANLLYAVFGLALGILLVSRTLGKIGLRKLTLRRDLPEHAMVGRPLNISYEIENQKRYWPTFSVTIAELDDLEAFAMQPHAHLLHVAAGAKATVVAEALAKRRGLHHLGRCQLFSSFPFGFIRRATELVTKDTLLVYPAVGAVDDAIFQKCKSAESSGAMMRPRQGGSDEFYGVKEYRSGDNPRWIYWRRSAHTGTLVAKEMTHVAPPRLLLLVDTHLSASTLEARAGVERVIAMAATLASEALERGLPMGLMAWSGRWIHVSPNRGKRHRRDILATLALLPANTSRGPIEMLNESHQHQKSSTTAVLITPGAESIIPADARSGLVVLPADGPDARSGFRFQKTVNFENSIPKEQVEQRTGPPERAAR